jgi:hypothetical protein
LRLASALRALDASALAVERNPTSVRESARFVKRDQ